MKRRLVMVATLTLVLAAGVAEAAEPLAFQGVMKDLGRHMQTVAGAIALEDWATVEKTAPLIAAHAQPPAEEKARIIQFMGANMGKFKSFDMAAHEAAHKMEHAAHEQNGKQVIDAYREVQSACLGCHQNFRKSFVEHFYGKQ